MTLRPLQRGLKALAVLVGLTVTVPAAVFAQSALAAPQGSSSYTTTQGPDELARYREALLARQSSAIAVHNATVKARYELKVKQLGYEPSITDPREIARQIMLNKYGWGDDQFACYAHIIMHESRWNPYADNPRSSAYGIPQALPGRRMAAFGADWRTNPVTQIRWGLDYVDDRYGSPCRAWSFKRGHGWY